jgi:hypothetical protein
MKTNDAMIKQLQNVVDEYKGMVDAAIVANTETSTSGTGSTEITKTDTVFIQDGDTTILEIYPEYNLNINDRWSIGRIIANKDSISYYIKSINEYEFTIGYGRWNPFKKRELTIDMKNLNPNTVTTDVRAYKKEISDRRLGLSVYGGYGITADFSGRVHHGVQLGIGASWRIYP